MIRSLISLSGLNFYRCECGTITTSKRIDLEACPHCGHPYHYRLDEFSVAYANRKKDFYYKQKILKNLAEAKK